MDSIKVCFEKPHLKATGTIALIVGTWLTLINQGDVIATSGVNGVIALKIGLNYITPFVVSNLGLLSRKH